MNSTEGSTLELKRQYTDEIKKTVIAFANTFGGVLYIGIHDDGTVAGVEDTDATMLRVSNSIRTSIRPDVTMFTSCSAEEIDGHTVVKVIVQKGTARPYYLSEKGLRPAGVYVRQGASSVPASRAAIFKMIRETGGDKYEELRSLEQRLTFAQVSKEFARHDMVFDADTRKKFHLVTEDGMYTNLALLLSDQCTHSVKAAVFEGCTKDILRDRREFTGSLVAQLVDVFSFISALNRTRSEINGLYREDERDYPVSAVREGLLNALVHREYSFSAGILINIYDDRLEIISVGGLAGGLTRDDILLGVSLPRNENLAILFYELRLIEAGGTGIQRIFHCYDDKARQPEISITDNAFRIMLPNLNYQTAKNAFPDVQALLRPREQSVSPVQFRHETAVLKLFSNDTVLTRQQIQERLNMSQSLAIRILGKMVTDGMLARAGNGPAIRYFAGRGYLLRPD
jgi:ATP-dependent DNA helicase RecG